MGRRLPRQDFALNLSVKRRLCNTVEGRVIEGTPRCCAVFYRAISRRSYDQLSALKPLFGLVRPLWRSKELRASTSS
jgi:hypothetical protein